jgi:hypothetical protein
MNEARILPTYKMGKMTEMRRSNPMERQKKIWAIKEQNGSACSGRQTRIGIKLMPDNANRKAGNGPTVKMTCKIGGNGNGIWIPNWH